MIGFFAGFAVGVLVTVVAAIVYECRDELTPAALAAAWRAPDEDLRPWFRWLRRLCTRKKVPNG